MKSIAPRRTLLVIMDGLGIRHESYGNAVLAAYTPNLDWLTRSHPYTTLHAHGTHVGLPSDGDIGNSEVGHNALGAGKIVDQGAKLVDLALKSETLFSSLGWQKAIKQVTTREKTLHFIGLLSDGNVHSHEKHLYALMRRACKDGVQKIRIHPLLDGRDVEERSALRYVERLEAEIKTLNTSGVDAKVASSGGRMIITMDRYQANWKMVEEGWNTHVHGKGRGFPSLKTGILTLREENPDLSDQYLPPFVICNQEEACGKINAEDAVLFFNFRGDRAIQISQAFEDQHFEHFERKLPKGIYYAGMMEYDGDLHIPQNYLVSPPQISYPLAEHLAAQGLRQYACSETQKYGHVTYFWNGNRSGYFDQNLEKYLEIPSHLETFDKAPWMKAKEITEATIGEMADPNGFHFGRINYANPDMVGHTGDFSATVNAVGVVDQMLGLLLQAAKKYDIQLIITADHGNSDEMKEPKSSNLITNLRGEQHSPPKTSHSKAPVPFILFDPAARYTRSNLSFAKTGNLGHVANTVLEVMGLPTESGYLESLIRPSP